MGTNNQTEIVYTRAIRKGVLRLTEMEVGSSVSGTIEGLEEGKYGTTLILNVPAVGSVKVYTAGNIKRFFADDQSKGVYNIGNNLLITRKEDATLANGMKVTQFMKNSKAAGATRATSQSASNNATTTDSKKAELQAKLAAARKSA